MSQIVLPAGTTVSLENIPLHQFYHISLHPATPAIIVVVYTLAVQLLNSTRGKTLSRIEAKRRALELDGLDNPASMGKAKKENGSWMTTFIVLHNLTLASFSYWCATNYVAAFSQTISEEGVRCAVSSILIFV